MDSLFAEADEFLEEEHEKESSDVSGVEVSPRNNPDLLGHEEIEKRILADYNAGHMPHAIILAGPVGIGKATLAYRLARFLLSQSSSEGSLLGGIAPAGSLQVSSQNPVFHRVVSGGHADLLVVEREVDEKKGRLKSEISVESVRRITPFLRKTAAEGGWRVVIVDSAEYLNTHSQNALLKILEEPPAKTVLILTTSQPGSFLPTVRSRCRMIPMYALPERTVTQLLDKMAPGLEPSEKTALCRFTGGSIGRSLQFNQNGGVALYKDLLKLVAGLPQMDMSAVHDMADRICKAGDENSFDAARDILTTWCERRARAEARDQVAVDIMPGDGAIFQKISETYPPKHFLICWEKISKLFWQVENYNLDKKQAVISAFLMLQKPGYQGLST